MASRTPFKLLADYFGSQPWSSQATQHLLPPNDVTISKTDLHQNKLGEGSYAKVYQGQYKGLPCAVKVFNKDCLKKELSDPGHGFEIAYLNGMTHENIVKVYGLWIDPYKGRDITAIVMELCEDSLEGYINKNRIISIDQKLQILNGVCKGMIFLHNEGIVHGDLRAPNILLVQSGDQIIAKVSDFSMSRYVDPQNLKHLTLRHADEDYLPPEVFHQRTPKQKFACLTFEVDTFCFGTLALQLGCREFPTPLKKVDTKVFGAPSVRTEVERRSSYLRKLKQSEKEVIDPIVRRCLADKPEDRPSFTDLHTTIETKLRRYREQPDLQLLQEKIAEVERYRAMELEWKEAIANAEKLKKVLADKAGILQAKDELLRDFEGNIGELQSKSHEQEKVIQQLNRERLNVQQEVEQLKNQRDTFKQKLDDAQASLKTGKEHTTSVEEQRDLFQKKLCEKESANAKLLRTVKDKEEEMEKMKQQKAKLESSAKEKDDRITQLKRKLGEREAQRDSLQTEKADLLQRNQQLEVDIQQQAVEREKVLKEKEDYLKQYENVERKLHRLNGNHSKKMAESEKEIQRLKDRLEEARKEQLTVQALAHEQKAPEERQMNLEVARLQEEISQLKRKLSEREAQRDSLQTEKDDLLHRNQLLEVNAQEQAKEREKVLKEKEDYLKQYEDVERKLHRLSCNHTKKMAESEKEVQRLKDLLEKARKEQLTVQALAQEQERQQTNEQGEKMKLMEEVAKYRAQESVLQQRVEQKQSELSEMAAKKDSMDAQLVTVIEEKRALLSTERDLTSKMEQTQKELKRMTAIAEKSAEEKDKEFQECQQLKEKAARLQGELAESQRASETQRNELVVTQVQRQLAEKERDELGEKYHEADQLICSLKQEAEVIREDLQNIKEKNAELRGQLGVVVENKHELEALRLKWSSAVADKARTEEKLLAASKDVLKLEEEAGEAKRQLHEAEGRCSDLEADKAKLQASQRFAEELEAEKDDYKGKLSNANELIMQHFSSQTKGGSPEHLPSKTEFHAMMEFFKVFYDKSSEQSEQTAHENQRLLAENNELKEKVQEMVQASLALQEKLSEKEKFLDEQQRQIAVLKQELSPLQEMKVVPSLASDVVEQTVDEVRLEQLCYMATGIKQLLITPDGGTFTLGSGDASLEFPPGAVVEETSVRYAVILHGPFAFPTGYKPGSVVVYLNMDEATLVKPVLLYMSHWCLKKEGVDKDILKFFSTPHTLEAGQQVYEFEEQEKADFTTRSNVGVLTIQKPQCLYCVEAKVETIARYCAIMFSQNMPSEDTLRFMVQLMCDSLDWMEHLTNLLQQKNWEKTSDTIARFQYATGQQIVARLRRMTGPGWEATIDGHHAVVEQDFLQPMGKSVQELKREVTSGRFPPSIRCKVIYTSSEEERVKPALVIVDVDGANGPLSFSCRIKEEKIPAQSVKVARSLSSPLSDISNTAVIKALNHELDARWREFGTHLCVKSAIMDIIDKNKKSDVGACMLHLVESWLAHDNGTGDLPRTWETVVQAVKSTGKGRLAEQLAQRYGVQPPGQ